MQIGDDLEPRRPPRRRRAAAARRRCALPRSTASRRASRVGVSVARADDDARLARPRRPSASNADGDAERRPVVGRPRGAFDVGRAPSALRRHDQLDDQLVAGERGFVIAGEQILDRDRALAARARRRRRARRARSSIGGRSICGSACARWPPTVATLRTRTFESVRSVRATTRRVAHHPARTFEFGERRHRADAQARRRSRPRWPR